MSEEGFLTPAAYQKSEAARIEERWRTGGKAEELYTLIELDIGPVRIGFPDIVDAHPLINFHITDTSVSFQFRNEEFFVRSRTIPQDSGIGQP